MTLYKRSGFRFHWKDSHVSPGTGCPRVQHNGIIFSGLVLGEIHKHLQGVKQRERDYIRSRNALVPVHLSHTGMERNGGGHKMDGCSWQSSDPELDFYSALVYFGTSCLRSRRVLHKGNHTFLKLKCLP